MASLIEIVARARTIAEGRGADANKNPIIDAGMTAEALVPHAMRYACEMASLQDLESTTRDHEIEVDLDGYGTLPESIIRKHLDSSFLPKIAHSSFTPWPDYNRVRFTNLLCYYTHRSNTFRSDCDIDYGDLIREIALVTKDSTSDIVEADNTSGSPASGYLTVLDNGAHARGSLKLLRPQGYSTGYLRVTQGEEAVGSFRLIPASLPIDGDGFNIDGQTFFFRTTPVLETSIQIMSNASRQAVEVARVLTLYATNHPGSVVNLANYIASSNFVTIAYKTFGTAGNAFTITGNARFVASGATLSGGINGVQEQEIVYVNGVKCQWTVGIVPSPGTIYLGGPSTSAVENAARLVAALSDTGAPSYVLLARYDSHSNLVNINHILPGAVGNQFAIENSDLGAIVASGAFLTGGTGGIVEGETILLGGATFTFTNFNTAGVNLSIPFGTDAGANAVAIVAFWNLSAQGTVANCTYSVAIVESPDEPVDPVIDVYFDAGGGGGNSFALANSAVGASAGSIVRSGTTLAGGGGAGITEGTTISVNGVPFTATNLSTGAEKFAFNASSTSDTARYFTNALRSSVQASVMLATYSNDGALVRIRYKTNGTIGNTFSMANSSGSPPSIVASASSLTGGTGDVGTGLFVATTDVGRRIIITQDNVEMVNAIIQERLTADAITIRNYRTGSVDTEITAGTAEIREALLEFIRSGTCQKDYGDPIVVDVESGASPDEVGYLLIAYNVDGTVLMRAIITEINGDLLTVAGYDDVGFSTPRNFNLYRVLDPTIQLNAVSVPTVPQLPTDDIEMSDKIAEDTILTLAGALTGEIPIMALLGDDTGQEAKSE